MRKIEQRLFSMVMRLAMQVDDDVTHYTYPTPPAGGTNSTNIYERGPWGNIRHVGTAEETSGGPVIVVDHTTRTRTPLNMPGQSTNVGGTAKVTKR